MIEQVWVMRPDPVVPRDIRVRVRFLSWAPRAPKYIYLSDTEREEEDQGPLPICQVAGCGQEATRRIDQHMIGFVWERPLCAAHGDAEWAELVAESGEPARVIS